MEKLKSASPGKDKDKENLKISTEKNIDKNTKSSLKDKDKIKASNDPFAYVPSGRKYVSGKINNNPNTAGLMRKSIVGLEMEDLTGSDKKERSKDPFKDKNSGQNESSSKRLTVHYSNNKDKNNAEALLKIERILGKNKVNGKIAPNEENKHEYHSPFLNKHANDNASHNPNPPKGVHFNIAMDKVKDTGKAQEINPMAPNKTKSDILSKSTTQRLEDNEQMRTLKETNNIKIEAMRKILYHDKELKKEVISYIQASGNYDTRNRTVPWYIILPKEM